MGDRIIIVGGGIFGITAALELDRRGYEIRLLEAGTIPAADAASTDISKMVRVEYGTDEIYTELAEASISRWHEWNDRWRADGRPAPFRDCGVLMLSREEMVEGDFEYESHRLLRSRGRKVERIESGDLGARFPALSDRWADGLLDPGGGYVESGAAVWLLAEEARRRGIEILVRTPARRLLSRGNRVSGIEDAAGGRHEADRVLLATGSWTASFRPDLAASLRRTYHPVWHLRPVDLDLFREDRFPVFTADITRTAYYGFPLHPVHQVVKIGHHGGGLELGEDADLSVPDVLTDRMREFLGGSIPTLAEAEVVHARLCPYCDTTDLNFWIARDPERLGLTLAAGGSGHAFKFAPLLGEWIADAVEGRENPLTERFRWRPEQQHGAPVGGQRFDAARCREES
jgi:glycine/D-amino acid oxidase-like deaminating enzyme